MLKLALFNIRGYCSDNFTFFLIILLCQTEQDKNTWQIRANSSVEIFLQTDSLLLLSFEKKLF